MRRGAFGLGIALCLLSASVVAHNEKRTDPCGCHHQWGLRHCHLKKKTPRCEAPARAKAPSENRKERERPRERSTTAAL
jgi:hypothetical protein